MKNLKVSAKLIVSFCIVLALTLCVGVAGVIGITQMTSSADHMYADMAVPMSDLAQATEYFQRIRVELRNIVIYSGEQANLDMTEDSINDRFAEFEGHMEAYRPSITSPDALAEFDETMELYVNTIEQTTGEMLDFAREGISQDELLVEMSETTDAAAEIADNLRHMIEIRLETMAAADSAADSASNVLLFVMLGVIVIAAGVAIFIALYVSRLISKPLLPLTAFMKNAGESGNIVLKPEDAQAIKNYAVRKDEIGQTIAAAAQFVQRVNEVSDALVTVAGGDLTEELVPLSDEDVLGLSLQKMTNNLNSMFAEINAGTSQVAIGANQVADGAQSLAQGATEQAASTEELSSTIADIAENSRKNAEMAEKSAELSKQLISNAETGNQKMMDMVVSVQDINASSKEIGQVIKTIEDIAFQTNILALNAAVEAARAGSAGKGFAVVAEEVRNLAGRCAQAAKDTNGMISTTIAKAEAGEKSAMETAEGLKSIVSGIEESERMSKEIAQLSNQQSVSIKEVNVGIDQVAQVVQQNSATAEESAAAAEEMSSQSQMLQELVARFRLRNAPSEPMPQARQTTTQRTHTETIF